MRKHRIRVRDRTKIKKNKNVLSERMNSTNPHDVNVHTCIFPFNPITIVL